MLSKKLVNALNDQINFEIYSAHIYLAMAAYCAEIGLEGFENWYKVQYEEELFHAKKMFSFVADKGGRVNISGFEDPKNNFKSLIETLEDSLHHEKIVTQRIYNLMDIAMDEREHATISFLKWYVDEQVEEEKALETLITKVKMLKDEGLYHLDQQVATRVFTPPVDAGQ